MLIIFIEKVIEMNKKRILEILSKSGFTYDFIEYVREIYPEKYQRKFEKPYHTDYQKNPLLKMDRKNRLIETLSQLNPLDHYYNNRNILSIHLYQSIYDLKYRVERFFDKCGTYGLSDRDLRWVAPVFEARIFDIGVLRYEMTQFTNEEIERSGYQKMSLECQWKKCFLEGTPILYIHILENADLRPTQVDKSLKMARTFLNVISQNIVIKYF